MTADPISAFAAGGSSAVAAALRSASEATGAGFELLYNMARRESALDPRATARASSAAGLFQFIEQTWLAAVKKYGPRHGLEAAAGEIVEAPNGRLTVADPARRKAILDLRFDPAKAAALAGELAEENRLALERRLGRPAGATEVYAAHFLGLGGAAKLLAARPEDKAAELLPKAAAANRPVFFDEAGRARTVREVLASIERSMNASRTAAKPPPAALRDGPSVRELAVTAAAEPEPSRARTAHAALAAKRPAPGAFGADLAPLALAAMQALDPTRLDFMRKDDGRRIP
ncbi:transglycosylase SLT domain-containing protein [Amphiplicatus metriothermophilus]|uniref:Transglycosylase SLT domain-containing protein n=1 Tax=Amphiplicatus metriothermophilus TaxID=1519374 RepID=A0A239PW56_9PROT|nr:transglycosylase SLT domain-containing protein [Amphiplicatus metriothermophilus]MBB5519622.1 hypothetical protein [Amphiplicatus metriothermophilus]SNT74186.1 Transglycosylase SLT domain-containing protein [Amphiplicatus metriothermophilus]